MEITMETLVKMLRSVDISSSSMNHDMGWNNAVIRIMNLMDEPDLKTEARALLPESLNHQQISEIVINDYIMDYYFYVIKGVPMLFKHYENGTDEPRIGGYPENVITSEDEMLEFIKTGFTREDGKHFGFHIEEERRDRIFRHIKDFFKKHPDGIITFG